MSIASKLTTLNTLVNNIKAKLRAWNLMPVPSGSVDPYGLEDCYTTLNQIAGTQTINSTSQIDVLGNKKRYAQVSDPYLSPENIVNGVTILGVTGTGGGSPPHITSGPCDIEYGSADSIEEVYYPSDAGYDYFNSVDLSEMSDSNPNKTLKSENIKYGTTILGVEGKYGQGSTNIYNNEYTEQGSGTMLSSISFDITERKIENINGLALFAIHSDDFHVSQSQSGSGILTNIMRVGTVHAQNYYIVEWEQPSEHHSASLNGAGIDFSIIVDSGGYRVTVYRGIAAPFFFYNKAKYILTLLY